MIILDLLFKICFTPFQNVKKNGRLAAIIWLCPSLAFTGMGLFNLLLHYSLNLRITTKLGTVMIFGLFGIIFYYLYMVYVKGNREVGKGRFPFLSGLLIFLMIVGSIVFMSISLAKFR